MKRQTIQFGVSRAALGTLAGVMLAFVGLGVTAGGVGPTTITAAGTLSHGDSGTLAVWGDDSARQISDAPAGEFSAIAKGGAFQGLAIRSDRTLALWGGYQDPFAVPPVPAAIAEDEFVFAALGRTFALAVRPDGTVVGWGDNSSGQLNVPAGIRFDAVAAGNSHSIGLAEDGTLRGWGLNNLGQTNVPAGRFTEIAARVHYTLALRDDGTLVGWGVSPNGIFAQWTPDGYGHFYVAGQKFVGIAAGNFHALAIKVNKTLAAWGSNAFGELDGPSGERFKEVGAGFHYSAGITRDGRLVAWGDNAFGLHQVPAGKLSRPGGGGISRRGHSRLRPWSPMHQGHNVTIDLSD